MFISFSRVYTICGNNSKSFVHNAHKLCNLFVTSLNVNPLSLAAKNSFAVKRCAPGINTDPLGGKLILNVLLKDYIYIYTRCVQNVSGLTI